MKLKMFLNKKVCSFLFCLIIVIMVLAIGISIQHSNHYEEKLNKAEENKTKEKHLVENRFFDLTNEVGVAFDNGVWNNSYWLLSSRAKESSLVSYNEEVIENFSGFISGNCSPKIFWNDIYWLIIDDYLLPEKTSLYRYNNKDFIDLTNDQIADRIKQCSPLLNDSKLWLLSGSIMSDTKHIDDATARIILYDGVKFSDITSKFIYHPESKGTNLIASGDNQWFVQLYHRGAPTTYSSYIVTSDSKVILTDLPSQQIKSIEWVDGKWFIVFDDGALISYDREKLELSNSKIKNIKITAIQASDYRNEILIAGFEQIQDSSISGNEYIGKFYVYSFSKNTFTEIKLPFTIKKIYYDDEFIHFLQMGRSGTIGQGENGWILSGKAEDSKDKKSKYKTYYIDSQNLKVADISFDIKHMPVGKAVWNGSHWLLFGSRIYKFIPEKNLVIQN